ncbi:hypothetical protein JMJ77_0007034 [Colletotrichum scovillei]|uniref:Uncharacterized protein n=1 Tax=Colletotrichum scovillei TaxID=1209932 RepID=A0A9P7RBQ0_9PEZI|nr:hypothetical protein JMJ77_0007034 [Colletotrichum scovillei]KAG7074034.1 hypothetical protein JMJ76_0010523 [Colletotrichum scovillei]KAG7081109.1 hypothetical protein JMJ78_0003238 [Colletotrichum scovillei]
MGEMREKNREWPASRYKTGRGKAKLLLVNPEIDAVPNVGVGVSPAIAAREEPHVGTNGIAELIVGRKGGQGVRDPESVSERKCRQGQGRKEKNSSQLKSAPSQVPKTSDGIGAT